MKFQYRPNTSIIDYNKLVKICTFDENGFYETDNPKIIKYLTKKARAVKVVEPVKKPTEKRFTNAKSVSLLPLTWANCWLIIEQNTLKSR